MLLEPTFNHCVRMYIPTEPVGLLEDVKAWLLDQDITGYTSFTGEGSWHDGHVWVVEPVVVIECWVQDVPDMVEFVALLILGGQDAAFFSLDGQAYLENGVA